MKSSLVVVFTQSNDYTMRQYLENMGLEDFGQEGCPVAAVSSSGGHCVDQHTSWDANILLVNDVEIDKSTRSTLENYINKNNKIIVVYHKGARNAISNHRTVMQSLCEGKEVCSKAEHSTKGNTFDCLGEIASAINDHEKRHYEKSVKRIIRFVCGDPILEAKLDLLHKLLVPPAEDSGGWKEIEEDWSNLMELIEDDSKANEHEEAWKDFIKRNPQRYSDDPFNEKYYGSEEEEGMLEELRDELLS